MDLGDQSRREPSSHLGLRTSAAKWQYDTATWQCHWQSFGLHMNYL